MPDHDNIYRKQARHYHRLIAAQPLLHDVIAEIRPYAGLDIVDLGAGTGRLAVALAPLAKSIVALDASEQMLEIAAKRLEGAGLTNWRTAVADHRALPLPDDSADLVVSGWSICYLASANVPDWKMNLRRIMEELERIVKPGGTVVIFENYGTGSDTLAPPDFLLPYFEELTRTYGFCHRWIRTDYRFRDEEEAEELTRFFFGPQLADKVAREKWSTVPECAGVWWRTYGEG